MKESIQDNHISVANQGTKTGSVNQALLLIERFAIHYVMLTLLFMICMTIGASQYLGIYKRAWCGDDHPYHILFFDIAFLFAISAILSLVKYIQDASNRSLQKSKPASNENQKDNNTNPATEPSGRVIVAPTLNQ